MDDVAGAERRRWVLVLGATLATAALAVVLGEHPAEQFDEGKLGTWASCLLLIGVSAAAFDTWRARRDALGSGVGPALLWLLVAAGFLYLACDDAFRFHEKLDRFLHRDVLHVEATALTARADDVIIGLYGLAGIGVLWWFRDELRRVPGLIAVLALGMALMFAQVGLDLANHDDVYAYLAPPGPQRRLLRQWLPVAEETTKLVAEAVFLLGMLRARRHARARWQDPLAP
jgi:hypothetical protein